jgi:hypothetical protein
MKVRHGFVSNSSTTSFCIVGISYPYPIVVNLQDEEYEEDEFPHVKGLEQHRHYDGCCGYIGVDIDKMQDDETLLQFKQKALEKLHQIPHFKNVKIEEVSILSDAWSDN